MKKIFSLVLFLIFISFFAQKKNQDYSFYENKGQIVDQNGKANPDVKYLLNSPGLNVQIKKNGFSYDVYEIETKQLKKKKSKESTILDQRKNSFDKEIKYKYHRIDIDFVDSKKNPEIVAEGKSDDYENYYTLPDKKEGVSFVHRYRKVTYKNLYNNIDLFFFKPEDSTKPVEYNFLVHPGGRMSDIKMKFKGAKTKLKDGKLSMNLRFGEMQENIPNSWIENDRKQSIAVNYKDLGNQIFGFESSVNNSDRTIVIDPVPTRIWGSYFGGNNTDYIADITTDKSGNVYFTGNTFSITNIATSGTFLSSYNVNSNLTGYLSKANSQSQKLWGTYLSAQPVKVHIDRYNKVISTGNNYLDDLIGTPGTHKPATVKQTHDAYILKLDENGIRIWGTYYGGSSDEIVYSSVIDQNDNVILVGYTESSNGIASAYAYQPNRTGYTKDSFIARINNFGLLTWATYYGGNGDDIIYDCTLDLADNVYLIGQTNGNDGIASANALQKTNKGAIDSFFSLFSQTGDFLYGSFYGGESNDFFNKIDFKNNKVLITGATISTSGIVTSNAPFPTILNTNSLSGAFSIFDKDGKLLMGSYFPEAIDDSEFDDKTNIFLSGHTNKNIFGTPGSYQPNINSVSSDAYIVKYDQSYNKLWGTYYGGNGSEYETCFHFDTNDKYFYLGGRTNSSNQISSPGAGQTTINGFWEDAFIVKFKDCNSIGSILINSNSPICIGKDIELTAFGGTSYLWTGPNGFTSALQNPKILNATALNSGTYSCTITGSGDCDGTFTTNVFVGDNIKPIPDLATLPKITGDCNTVVSTIPTATDNCKGKIIATTTDPLSYSLSGNYTINWKYDDGNGNIETQTQQVEITQQPLPTANSSQTFCKINNPKISDINVTATNPKWYDASGVVITNLSTSLVDNTKYYVTQNSIGCESAKKEILVTLSDPNPPTGKAIQDFCSASSPTLKNISITGTDIKWYNNIGIQIPDTTPLVDGTTYYASQTVNTCESTQKLAIKVNVATNYLSAKDYFPPAFCNDTTANFKTINLDDYKKELITNPQDYTFEFRNSSNQIASGNINLNIGSNIFDVRITSSLGCYQDVKLSLTLNPKPEIKLRKEEEFCDNLGVELDAGSGFGYSYDWNTGEKSQKIIADKEQTYTVKVTNTFGCDNTASVIVKKAKLASIQNILINNNNATIIMSFAGDYLYSLDQINWQSSNKFQNLSNENYTVFVKTNLGCDLGSKSFTIFSLSNLFSPNGDGINDTWKISGIENYPNSEIKIMDKNGIMVVNQTTKGEAFEWNGESNGRKLPTDSYWYQIKLSDGRILEGYVVIKSRN